MPLTDHLRASSAPPPTVLLEEEPLALFLAAASVEYERVTPDSPVPCFALLAGEADAGLLRVTRVVFAANARTTDPSAVDEFADTIVPTYGPAYTNAERGWWASPRDVLAAARAVEADGLDLLGSIHMHPDWHRIALPAERSTVLSERPTPMDEYVFAQAGWPVNLICYLERRGPALYHSLGAWGPRPADDRPDGDGRAEPGCRPLPLRTVTRPYAATATGRAGGTAVAR